MQKIFQSSKAFLVAHKKVSIAGVIVIALVGYWGYGKLTSTAGETRYVTAAAEKGTLVVSITGSGQVSASNQLDLKPKASGDVIYVTVKNGQAIQQGALIASLDSTDAQKSVRDAEANLQSAKLSLQKLVQPADTLSLTQSQNALDRARESKQNAIDDLVKAHEDAFTSVTNAFLDLPTVMAGLQDILYSSVINAGQANIDSYTDTTAKYDEGVKSFKTDAETKYQFARKQYDKNFQDYKAIARSSDDATVEKILQETYDTSKSISEAVKSANNLIQFYEDKLTERNLKPAAIADTHLASLNTHTGKTNTHITNLLNAKNTILNDQQTITNAERTIAENTQSLAKLEAGADTLDIASAKLTVTQRENALADARSTLADYSIRAPFTGTVGKLTVNKGDTVSSGTTVATLITKQKIAEVSLNEVDVAKIKSGQKATLTFDAVEGLSIAGQVIDVDTIGTVSQGVVTYNVKIGFDTDDDRIKPGMSVSAAIITDLKQDVIIVPNAAVKSQDGTSYVQMFSAPLVAPQSTSAGSTSLTPPLEQQVTIGLSNDTSTEIVSGLKEGDTVVTNTITSSTASSATSASASSGLRIPGVTGGGTGATRSLGR